jgi:hypothetical protein
LFLPLPNHPDFNDLTDREFGQWKVIGYVGGDRKLGTQWWARCSCGNEKGGEWPKSPGGSIKELRSPGSETKAKAYAQRAAQIRPQ